jgi:ABC-type transport system involved in Fe-S cluster assembly fused permease/ATPase subunit
MAGYEEAAIKTNYSLAFLNFGQSLLITCGLVGVMILAAIGVQNGDLTVGDFVMVNAYMVQLTVPLNFLGDRLSRNPSGAGRYGADVHAARSTGRNLGQA